MKDPNKKIIVPEKIKNAFRVAGNHILKGAKRVGSATLRFLRTAWAATLRFFRNKPLLKRIGRESANSLLIAGRVFRNIFYAMMNTFLTVLLVMGVTGVIVACTFALYLYNYVDATVEEFDMISTEQDQTTMIYYVNEDGEIIELESQRLHSDENRIWVSYDNIPKYLKDAFVAIEDKRFFDHNGVDWIRTVRATALFAVGQSDSGGSTITQQLIKNTTGEDSFTIQRKIEEIFRALNLEKSKSKEEILELYLNTIYLSQGCNGVKTAAEKYFGKDVSELSLIECAAIAGITQNPYKWDPILHPENNKERRDNILIQMYEQGKINRSEFESAHDKELVLYTPPEEDEDTIPEEEESIVDGVKQEANSWYTDTVVEDAIDLLQEKYNVSEAVASQMLYASGLQLVIAMDEKVQSTLEAVYEDDALFTQIIGKTGELIAPESAMIVLDPTNGNILGIVGGRGEKTKSRLYNCATMAKRQSGSSIKPLSVYGQGLQSGKVTWSTVYDDAPVEFWKTTSNGSTTYRAWPKNSPATYGGLTTVADGITRSVNTLAVQILSDVGIRESFDFLTQKLHFTTLVEEKVINDKVYTDLELSCLALGGQTDGVTVRELVGGYTMITNDGVFCEPRSVLQIKDRNGNILIDNRLETEKALSVENAAILTRMMMRVMNMGTGSSSTLYKKINTAGKTGTTSSNYDRWFVGFTPYYLGGVWFGYRNQQSITGYSGNPALKIWDYVMLQLHDEIIKNASQAGGTLKRFELPSTVIEAQYCRDSGKLATQNCRTGDPRGSRVESGYFTADQLPTEYCDCHVTVDYCTIGKGIACDACPESAIKQVALIHVPDRSYPAWTKVTDAQYVYRQLEVGQKFRVGASYAFFETQRKSGEYFGTSSVSSAYNRVCTSHYIVNTSYEGKYNKAPINTSIPTGSLLELPSFPYTVRLETTVEERKRAS
ncbi:MAG: hypothetical protein E7599_05485 [Ruminococcaceae bacterium]|nr:hypothetical protein [Oscillospiraceae bacterium]